MSFPLREAFTIARGSKTQARVVEVTLVDGEHTGRGESVPYGRYSETPEGVLNEVRSVADWLGARASDAATRQALTEKLGAGAARNAIDLALIDLDGATFVLEDRPGLRLDEEGLHAPDAALWG